jgi:hypothetical protein
MHPSLIRCALLLAAVVLAVADCDGDDVSPDIPVSAVALAAGGTSPALGGATAPEKTTPDTAAAPVVIAKSAKRGVAYDLASPADFAALARGVSWWYNWTTQPASGVPADYGAQYQMDFYPMIWGMQYEVGAIEDYLRAHPRIKYLLVMNEPNLTSQADLTPQQAASLWPDFEEIAAVTGVQIVGPAITWGTMAGYSDPVVWLDDFYAAYAAANDGREPRIDYLAFHWYDYGLGQQLDRLAKYHKPFWVTEFANWHSRPDGGQVDSPERQAAQMTDMVAVCESRADVFRYAWFTGRVGDDAHASSLLSQAGTLTPLGELYLSLPYAQSGDPPAQGT